MSKRTKILLQKRLSDKTDENRVKCVNLLCAATKIKYVMRKIGNLKCAQKKLCEVTQKCENDDGT